MDKDYVSSGKRFARCLDKKHIAKEASFVDFRPHFS